jgi:hypothetical protein
MSSTFILRACSSARLLANNTDDSSAPSYAERIVRINQDRLKAKPDCAESQRKARKWAANLERERKGR